MKRKFRRLYTIGYERRSKREFIQLLQANEITHIADVRDWPHGSYTDFNKYEIENWLKPLNVTYSYHKPLGNALPGREAARRGDIAEFRRIFGSKLNTNAAKAEMHAISRIVSRRICLLCYCRQRANCHAGMIAEAIIPYFKLPIRLTNIGE